jgi:hypothetical protein
VCVCVCVLRRATHKCGLVDVTRTRRGLLCILIVEIALRVPMQIVPRVSMRVSTVTTFMLVLLR